MSKKRYEIEKEELEKYFSMHMTYKEIAAEMSISPKTVESYISKALKLLRKELKDYLPIILLFTFLK